METPGTAADRETLAALQRELASRASVLHFAHSAVSTILALIAAGTTAKMTWDLDIHPETEIFVYPVAAFSMLCFIYGFIRYIWGRSELKRELVSFAKLQALRRKLNLEDPSALLPS
jgi:hypothetical protein